MSTWDRMKKGAKRGGAVIGIISNVAGAGHAAPPSEMPDTLAKQYRGYSRDVRLPETRRDIKRATAPRRGGETGLDKNAAKKLRGRR